MRFIYKESPNKDYWMLFLDNQDGTSTFIAYRPTLLELQLLVAMPA